MQLGIKSLFAAFALAQIVSGAAIETRAAQHCGNTGDAVALLRGYHPPTGDHFYTTNAGEMENAVANLGYHSEGITGFIFPTQEASTTPFYRLYNGKLTDHFYTTSATERDSAQSSYTYEGIAGYVYSDSGCGGVPLYRLYHVGLGDHFYTSSQAERNSAASGGYVYEGIAAYILPA